MQPDENPEAVVDNGDDFDYKSDGEGESFWVVWSVLIKMKHSLIWTYKNEG